MNIHSSDRKPDRDKAAKALETLRIWAGSASPTEVSELDPAIARLLPDAPLANYPDLNRSFEHDFAVDEAYRATLPDLQNGPASLIRGAKTIEFPPADPLSYP